LFNYFIYGNKDIGITFQKSEGPITIAWLDVTIVWRTLVLLNIAPIYSVLVFISYYFLI